MDINTNFICNGRLNRFVVFHTYEDRTWIDAHYSNRIEAENKAIELKKKISSPNEIYIMEVNQKVAEVSQPSWGVVTI